MFGYLFRRLAHTHLLLLGYFGVELLEKRGGLIESLAALEGAGRPGAGGRSGVVAQGGVLAEAVLERLGVLGAEERFFIAEDAVQGFAAVGDEGSEEQLQAVDAADGGVNGGAGGGLVGLDGAPGRLLVQVFVYLGSQAYGFRQGAAQLHCFQQVTYGGKATFDCLQDGLVSGP